MKIILKVQWLCTILVFCFVLAACPPVETGGNDPTQAPQGNPTAAPVLPSSVLFKEVLTKDMQFGYPDDGDLATIQNTLDTFFIAQCEVSYKIWKTIFDWSRENGYSYTEDCGKMGYTINPELESKLNDRHPVTYMSWRDAIVYSNAFTAYYNAHNNDYDQNQDLDYVFYTDSSCDEAHILKAASEIDGNPWFKTANGNSHTDLSLCSSDGFRIPSEKEWVMAAKWVGYFETKPEVANDVMLRNSNTGYCWYRNRTLSGIYDSVHNKLYNPDEIAVCKQESTAPIASKQANQLGLYDMIGNCNEYIFCEADGFFAKGGFWKAVDYPTISYITSDYSPDEEYYKQYYNNNGIRLVKSPSRDASNPETSIDSQVQGNLNKMFL